MRHTLEPNKKNKVFIDLEKENNELK